MIAKAVSRFLRISPRKVRLVADMVRNKSIDEAQAVLMNMNKRACLYIKEALNSAVANASRNPELSPSGLYISKITVDTGPMFKRYKAGSMGRAMMIRHRTSHISIELDLKKHVIVQKPKDTAKKEAVKEKAKKLVAAKRGK